MFYLVGQYVRLGPEPSDIEHSVMVSSDDEPNKLTFVSMNKSSRKLFMHVWLITDTATGLLAHVHSELYAPLLIRYHELGN